MEESEGVPALFDPQTIKTVGEYEKASECPKGWFVMRKGAEDEPEHFLDWQGPGFRSPCHCKKCHVPQWEPRVEVEEGEEKKTHGCVFLPCESWRNCIGNYAPGHKQEINLIKLKGREKRKQQNAAIEEEKQQKFVEKDKRQIQKLPSLQHLQKQIGVSASTKLLNNTLQMSKDIAAARERALQQVKQARDDMQDVAPRGKKRPNQKDTQPMLAHTQENMAAIFAERLIGGTPQRMDKARYERID